MATLAALVEQEGAEQSRTPRVVLEDYDGDDPTDDDHRLRIVYGCSPSPRLIAVQADSDWLATRVHTRG